MNHADYAAQARSVQLLIDEAIARRQYEKLRELSEQLVEWTRQAYRAAGLQPHKGN